MDWLTPQIAIGLIAALGVGSVFQALVSAWLRQRETERARRLDKEKSNDAASSELAQTRAEDSAHLRSELWQNYKDAQARNDQLSQNYGVVLQEKAQLFGENESLKRQVSDLVNRLTAEGLRVEDAVYRQKKAEGDSDRAQVFREQADQRVERLLKRIDDLEIELATAKRGRPSRADDEEHMKTRRALDGETPAEGRPVLPLPPELVRPHDREQE